MTGQSDTTSRDFFDTNILVYMYDDRDPQKQDRAFNTVTEAVDNNTGVVSAQVLGEFFNTVTRRIPNSISVGEAQDAISMFAQMTVVALDLELVRRAVETCGLYQVSYWDALIIAAAERAGCGRIISEDLNAGQSYHGVVVVNPFVGGL